MLCVVKVVVHSHLRKRKRQELYENLEKKVTGDLSDHYKTKAEISTSLLTLLVIFSEGAPQGLIRLSSIALNAFKCWFVFVLTQFMEQNYYPLPPLFT